jgi:hypothetical protein
LGFYQLLQSDGNIPIFEDDTSSVFHIRLFRTVDAPCDALSALGVRLWHPSHRIWTEVSVLGNIYESRLTAATPGKRLRHLSNELSSGSIIDVAGTLILFHSGSIKFPSKQSDWIERINAKKPLCPVLLRRIKLEPHSNRNMMIQSYANRMNPHRLAEHVSNEIHRSMSVSQKEDSYDNGFMNAPFVFTACGHVHSYSKELVGK